MSKVMHGARARVGIYSPLTGKTKTIGIFNTISWGLTYEVAEASILGRYSPAELTYVAQNKVTLSMGGYRVLNFGPHAEGAVPKLQDLLNHEYVQISVIDRQSESNGGDGRFVKFRSVRPTGYHTNINARNQTEMTISAEALIVDDENSTNVESAGSTDLP